MTMTKDATEEFRADLDQVRDDLKQLRRDMTKATGALYEAGRSTVADAGQGVKQGADDAVKYVDDFVKHRPVTSLLTAAGVGLLVGALFRHH